MKKATSSRFENGRKWKRYLSATEYSKRTFLKPKKIPKFLIENKRIVLLNTMLSSYDKNYIPAKKEVFYEVFHNVVPESRRFDLSYTGYCNDIAILEEYAYRMIKVLSEIGYYYNDKNWYYFDVEDYELYIQVEIEKIKKKRRDWGEYVINNRVEVKKYKRNNNSSINNKEHIYDTTIERFRKENIDRCNKHEHAMKSILDEIGIEYEYQKVFHAGNNFYIVDFYIPQNNVIIEVDGGVHYTMDGLLKDRRRDADFAQLGVLTIRYDATDPMFVINARVNLPKILDTKQKT